MNSNDLSDIYEYHTQLDMEQYTQYLEYFEQYEAMEEDEAESSVKHTRRYIARDRELAEDKLRRDYFGDENTPPVYPEEYFRRRYPDKAPEAPFQVNGKTYEKCYYLADEIYPQWSTFVKAFSIPRDQKTMKFKRVQESARKNIERAFGVLQDQKFDISEYWHMYASLESNIQRTWIERCKRQRRRNKELLDRRVHEDLRHDIGTCVQNVFGLMVPALLRDKTRIFIYVKQDQHTTRQKNVKEGAGLSRDRRLRRLKRAEATKVRVVEDLEAEKEAMGKKCDVAVISRDRGTYAPEFNQFPDNRLAKNPEKYPARFAFLVRLLLWLLILCLFEFCFEFDFIVECYAIAHTYTHVMRLFKPDYTEKLQKGCDCEYDRSKVLAEYELIPESLKYKQINSSKSDECEGSNGDCVPISHPIARSSSSFGDLDRYRTAIENARTRSKIAKGLAIPVTMESTAEKSQVWVELDKSLNIWLEQRLKAEKEDLEQKVKSMNTLSSFMIPAPGIQAAYSTAIAAAQGQTMISNWFTWEW
ncbi:ALP1-like protein isoform X1 [Tanacetum coccineum]